MNYIGHSLIVTSTITGCVSISAFAFLVGLPTRITSRAVELKICVRNAAIEKYKSIIKEKKEKHYK